LILERRKSETMRPVLLTGPGKVASALALDTSFSGHALFRARGVLSVREGDAPSAIVRGPRVGIGYAMPEHQAAPWRLAIGDSLWVSARRGLR
jgi:DNA-3-methyladenine glycosylase